MKKLVSFLLSLCLILSLCLSALASGDLVVDEADLLSDQEESYLENLAENIRRDYAFDAVILSVPSLNGKTAEAYADDYFDYNGYGQGSDFDGALMLISMEERQYAVSTCGYGIIALTDYGLDEMSEAFLPHLKSGDYAQAYAVFLNYTSHYLDQAQNNVPVDVYNPLKDGSGMVPAQSDPVSETASHIWVHVLIALAIAGITILILKGQLRSIYSQGGATQYSQSGLQLTVSSDRFLYERTTRTPKPKDNDSDGGSSTHSSSSGRSHGGKSGGF